jgi:hypothetical protein
MDTYPSLKLDPIAKTRSDKRKKKYQNKLSALIKGLNAVGKDLDEKFKFSSASRQTTLRSSDKETKAKEF